MSEALVPTIIGAVVGILATLLTIFLTPRLQHYFWKRQRLAELRFEVVDKINWLMADFITQYIAHEQNSTPFRPSSEFFKSLQVATAMIRVLFSDQTWDIFKKLEVMIGPRLGAPGMPGSVDEFIRARDKALRALYEEMGLSLPTIKQT